MANIVATFDTVTKNLKVTVDGKEVQDLCEASFYECYGELDEEGGKCFQARVISEAKDKTNKVCMTNIMRASVNKPSEEYKDLYVEDQGVAQAIAFLKRK